MENSVTLGGYKITFLGSTISSDTQTWRYKITKNNTPNPPIVNWGIELSFNPRHKVISATGPTTARVGMGQPCLPFAANAVIWEGLNNDSVNGFYTFTLEGNYQEAPKQVAVYTGEFCHKAFIIGPASEIKIPDQEMEQEAALSKNLPEIELDQTIQHQQPRQKLQEENKFITRGVRIF